MSTVSPASRIAIREHVPLGPLTTFKVGGPARYYVEVKTADEVQSAAAFAKLNSVPFVVFGGGANLLVADRGYPGLAIRIVDDSFTVDGNRVRVGAGMPIGRFLQHLAKAGLSGLEAIVGVPGTVGGAIVGNAGTATEWIGSRVSTVTAFDAEPQRVIELKQSDCDFRYRNSRFKENRHEIILAATFTLTPAPIDDVRKKMREYLARRGHQPAGDACAGCIFVNPGGETAGKLIDRAGLKGKTIGGAKVSEDHANFILNTGTANAEHIAMLISYVKQQIRDRFGIQLTEEVRYVGFGM